MLHTINEFKRYLLEIKENHTNGTYVSLDLSKESTKDLVDWLKKNDIETDSSDSFHVTVVYSRKGIPKAAGYKITTPIKTKAIGWEIFDTKMDGTGKCLVLKVDSKILEKHHEHYKKAYGATWDYDSYIPHITINTSYGSNDVPDKIPDFEIILDKMNFTALKD